MCALTCGFVFGKVPDRAACRLLTVALSDAGPGGLSSLYVSWWFGEGRAWDSSFSQSITSDYHSMDPPLKGGNH